ncbi:MAG: HEAT repeat domain-containing protein [Candidatus Aminicenantes bacterium]|nr:HEAT repeat domain-containing protein [Candidatus Aminicenantes bacterium]
MNDFAIFWAPRILAGFGLFVAALFLFIIGRRLDLQRREKIFTARYKMIEQEIVAVLYTTDEKAIARIAVKYRTWPDVLTSVLVNLIRIVGGEEKIILKTIFALTLRDDLIIDLESGNYRRRLTATRLLGMFADPANVPALLRRLRDKPTIQFAAVNSIAGFPDDRVLDFVFRAFEADPKPNIHHFTDIVSKHGQACECYIREALRKPLSEEKIGILIEMTGLIPARGLYPDIIGFAAHQDKEVRIKVARALGRLLIPDSFEVLAALAEDPAWEVEAQAVRSLGRLNNQDALSVLARGLHSLSWHVRNNSKDALLDMGAVGIRKLREVSDTTQDQFAADMAEMGLEEAEGLRSA